MLCVYYRNKLYSILPTDAGRNPELETKREQSTQIYSRQEPKLGVKNVEAEPVMLLKVADIGKIVIQSAAVMKYLNSSQKTKRKVAKNIDRLSVTNNVLRDWLGVFSQNDHHTRSCYDKSVISVA